MKFSMRPATEAERMYAYTQSIQIMAQTGCIGHLRAEIDEEAGGFFSTWDDHRAYLKTDEFKAEFDKVINELRKKENLLHSRKAIRAYCETYPEASMNNDANEYCFRADTETYAYILRVNGNKGEYNLYCYCYKKDWLDSHLRNAEKGIRFIDVDYNTLFKLPDGHKVKVQKRDGSVVEKPCRYIDEYHLEYGESLVHICQLAEMFQADGSKVLEVMG